jgi:hypothetical protein
MVMTLDVGCPSNYENSVGRISIYIYIYISLEDFTNLIIYLFSYGEYIVIFKLLSSCTLPLDACNKIKSKS